MFEIEQIIKHERLIETNKRANVQVQMGMDMAMLVGVVNEEFIDKHRVSKGYNDTHIKHSELMIRLFKSFLDDGCVGIMKAKIIASLVKANALDIEDFMRDGVKYEFHTEQEYKEHMDKMMAEVMMWDRELNR